MKQENEPKRVFGYESPARADRFEDAAARAWNVRCEGADSEIEIIKEKGNIAGKGTYDIHVEIDKIVSRINVPQNFIDQMNS